MSLSPLNIVSHDHTSDNANSDSRQAITAKVESVSAERNQSRELGSEYSGATEDLAAEHEAEMQDEQLKRFEEFNLSHALSVASVEKLLETDVDLGLTSAEVAKRLEKYGKNALDEVAPPTLLRRIWEQLNSLLIFTLFVVAIISLAIEAYADFVLIALVLIINVLIGLDQEGRATAASNSLKAMLSSKAVVVRDNGKRCEVLAEEVVPGDVVFIESGAKVPCDIRLFSAVNLTIQESMLTGESLPSSKNTKKVHKQIGVGDRKCIAFSATLCLKGQGFGICVATGDRTEIGKINRLVSGVKKQRTELQKQIDSVGTWIATITIPIAITAFLLSYFTGFNQNDWKYAFIEATAIVVAILPASLPAILTITLAAGMNSLAKKNTIVKTLPSVETLGAVMVICSDKTGTLTKNEMTAVNVRTTACLYDVEGAGYAPVGNIVGTIPTEKYGSEHLHLLLLSASLCSDSRLEKKELRGINVYSPIGDPTECALGTLIEKSQYFSNIEIHKIKSQRLGVIPFESEHKFMVTVNPSNTCFFLDENYEGKSTKSSSKLAVLNLKGAPDRLIPHCKFQLDNDMKQVPIDATFWNNECITLAKKGLRTIAICQSVIDANQVTQVVLGKVKFKNICKQLTIVCHLLYIAGPDYIIKREINPNLEITIIGIVGIMDPPREECIIAIREAHTAGVEVKMITGDHPSTAQAIGKMLNLINEKQHLVVTGPELDAMSRPELKNIVLKCNIFARASPSNKIQIVTALQDNKKLCSMTGDGVNDAPALAAADIGVAMGITGTDVSKDAAKIVLADDNFANIILAVKVGRTAWDNIRKILIFNQPVNFAQGLANFVSICLQWKNTPMTAIQILYVNMVTSVLLGLAFAVEPPEKDVMTRSPRRVGKRLIGKMFLWRIVFVTTIMVVSVMGSFSWMQAIGYSLAESRGCCVTTMVMIEISYGFSCRFLKQSSMHKRILSGNRAVWYSNVAMILCQLFVLYVPGVNTFFSVSGIDGVGWGIAFIFTVAMFLIIEFEKAMVDPFFKPYIKPCLEKIPILKIWQPEPYHRHHMEDLPHEHGGNIKVDEVDIKQDQVEDAI